LLTTGRRLGEGWAEAMRKRCENESRIGKERRRRGPGRGLKEGDGGKNTIFVRIFSEFRKIQR
jgi:hypothetical protein